MAGQVIGGVPEEVAVPLRVAQHVAQDAGEVAGVAVAEGPAAGADGLLEPAALRAHDQAAAGDSLQGHDAERLLVTRGDDHHPVPVEDRHHLPALLEAQEGYPAGDSQPGRLLAQPRRFRPVADDRQPGLEPLAGEDGQGLQEEIHALVRDQPADEDEVARPLDPGKNPEEIVAVGVRNHHRRRRKVGGHGVAHRDRACREAQEIALQPVRPGDPAVGAAVPAMVGDDPGTAHQEEGPEPPQTDVGLVEDVAPAGPAQELPGPGPPDDAVAGGRLATLGSGPRHHHDLVPRACELLGEGRDVDFQAADLRQERGRVDQQPHAPPPPRSWTYSSAWRASECPRYHSRAAEARAWASPASALSPEWTGSSP